MTTGACQSCDRLMLNRLGVNLLPQAGVTTDAQLPGFGPQNMFIISCMRTMAVKTLPGSKGFVFSYPITVFQDIQMAVKTEFRIVTFLLEQVFFPSLVRQMAFTAQSLGKWSMQAQPALLAANSLMT